MISEVGARDGAPPRIIKVLHVIPWLRQGGAEAMLANLVRAGDPRLRHHVHTITPADDFFELDPELVTSGSGQRGWPSLRMLRELNATIKRQRPDIVHAWMYHANFVTGLVSGRNHKTVWSIHNAGLTAANSKLQTRLVSALCAKALGRVPDRIVYVSRAVRDAHETDGYDRRKGIVIANGVDLERFRLRPARTRSQKDTVKIALVGRYDPIKGHHFLIDVVARHPERHRIELTFVGQDCDTAPALTAAIERAGLRDRCTVAGAIRSIDDVYADADIIVLPSFAEALPMTVLEAAATGAVICASRVGELATIGIEPRFMFEPGDADGCGAALSAAIRRGRCPDRGWGTQSSDRRTAQS